MAFEVKDKRVTVAGAARSGVAAAELVGLEASSPLSVAPAPGLGARHLYVYLKVRPTPDRYPRREGMARKRPLAG